MNETLGTTADTDENDLTKEIARLYREFNRQQIWAGIWFSIALATYFLVVMNPLDSFLSRNGSWEDWMSNLDNLVPYWRIVVGGSFIIISFVVSVRWALKGFVTSLRQRQLVTVKMACDRVEEMLKKKGVIH